MSAADLKRRSARQEKRPPDPGVGFVGGFVGVGTVHDLARKGWDVKKIAKGLGLTEKAVRKALK